MKCIILSDNLKKILTLIERSTVRDITLPILNSFLISAESGLIKITGTNLELGVESSIRGSIQENGSIVIPAKIFSSYISTLQKNEKVGLESIGNDVVIKTQSQETIFKGFPFEDFPPFPHIKELYTITLGRSDILGALTKTLVAISRSTIKPELSSVLFKITKETVVLSSTDSFRLSEEKIKPISYSAGVSQESFLLPLRTCEELIKICEFSDESEVIFSVGRGEVFIRTTNTSLYSRLTEGNFPEYQQIISKQYSTSVVVDRQLLAGHIKRASIFSNKLNSVTLTLNPESKTYAVESNNSDIGDYKAEFQSDSKGSPITIAFNFHYLLDGVESFTDESLFMGFNGDSSPLLIKSPKKESSLYVVMPMKGAV